MGVGEGWERDRTAIFCLLIDFPNTPNRQSSAKAWNQEFFWVSHVGGRDCSSRAIYSAFLNPSVGNINREIDGRGRQTSLDSKPHSDMGYQCHKMWLKLHCNTSVPRILKIFIACEYFFRISMLIEYLESTSLWHVGHTVKGTLWCYELPSAMEQVHCFPSWIILK